MCDGYRVTLATYIHDHLPLAVLKDWIRFVGIEFIHEVVLVAGTADGSVPGYCLRARALHPSIRIVPVRHHGLNAHLTDSRGVVEAFRQIATDHYVLVKLDTLPWRRGHEHWLPEALDVIGRNGFFALTGTFYLRPEPSLDGLYVKLQSYSNNFALGRTELTRWVVTRRLAGLDDPLARWALSGAVEDARQITERMSNRFLTEHAIDGYLQESQQYTICRKEDLDWTVFHVNQWGDALLKTRARYRRRLGIRGFLNTRPFYYGYPEG